MTRRKLLYSFFAAPALIYPCYLEPRWLDVTHRTVRLPRPLDKPLRLLHISDLHASFVVPLSMIDHAITLGLAEKPDLICVTGDFITGRNGVDPAAYARVLRRLSAAAPAFAVLGNHDGGEWAQYHHGYSAHKLVDRLLEDSRIELLHNRSVDTHGITLAGVGDL